MIMHNKHVYDVSHIQYMYLFKRIYLELRLPLVLF